MVGSTERYKQCSTYISVKLLFRSKDTIQKETKYLQWHLIYLKIELSSRKCVHCLSDSEQLDQWSVIKLLQGKLNSAREVAGRGPFSTPSLVANAISSSGSRPLKNLELPLCACPHRAQIVTYTADRPSSSVSRSLSAGLMHGWSRRAVNEGRSLGSLGLHVSHLGPYNALHSYCLLYNICTTARYSWPIPILVPFLWVIWKKWKLVRLNSNVSHRKALERFL